MRYTPLTSHNVMELWLYDACNFRCGYCSLVTSGGVTKVEQLEPFRQPEYISRLLTFFRSHRPGGRNWAVLLTGGEPLLMPNLDAFVSGLAEDGGTVGIYSNLSMSISKAIPEPALRHVSYVEASFHPDWHMGKFAADSFFGNVAEAKALGVPVLVRFVGAPPILGLLPDLEQRCQDLGVSLLPTTLFNPEYPRKYSTVERAALASRMVGYSSLIQLDGGLDMTGRRCQAGGRIFAARLHQGGDITPCISTDKPVIGNVLDNRLAPIDGLNPCYRSDQVCTCDIHFQQGIVEGADDSKEFEAILAGQARRRASDFPGWKAMHGLVTTDRTWSGQGVVLTTKADLLRQPPSRPDRVETT